MTCAYKLVEKRICVYPLVTQEINIYSPFIQHGGDDNLKTKYYSSPQQSQLFF
jgi:hypothetical protein